MAELHQALQMLSPVEWSDVPVDNLEPFLRQIFDAGEIICDSVPPPAGGVDFAEAKPVHAEPDSASNAQEIVASEARAAPPHPDHADLQKAWGKPLKVGAKENPLGISVYKMAGKDRNGAWFGRRSVHEGISFTKFKKAMQREFAESLAVQGGPGEGNVRGIGGDQRLERKKVDGVGQLEVYQLSAQFPGPTTPREFITLLSTSEEALTEKSSQEREGHKRLPRHYMVVSKPCNHPDAPERSGYIRGYYESVELIREIPIHTKPTGDDKDSSKEQEVNPVEWIMITRSDPGGGIPRFLVERGTPGSICGDAVKFLNWACAKGEIPGPDDDEEEQKAAQAKHIQQSSASQETNNAATTKSPAQAHAQEAQGGMFSSITNAIGAGIEAYAPAPIATYTHNYMHQEDEDDSSSDSSSDDSSSFASAQERPTYPTPQAAGVPEVAGVRASTDTLNMSSASIGDTPSTRNLPHTDKELRKLELQREKLDQKITKKKEAEDEKLKAVHHKDDSDLKKAKEKHDKEVKKLEAKRKKELAKIESKKEKEKRKAEKKQQKNLDHEAMSRVSRERDDFRDQVDALKKQNTTILQQYEELQRENALLVQKLSQAAGVDAVKALIKDG
ncbi:hypothetical protein AAFC00_004730 [Neodothiora populina]|uniref:DUF3074 domain-containing protein n=1 Tax=Neodothiora populina TaxID=2781224 RepID=A0ABR3P3B2_9PEZI